MRTRSPAFSITEQTSAHREKSDLEGPIRQNHMGFLSRTSWGDDQASQTIQHTLGRTHAQGLVLGPATQGLAVCQHHQRQQRPKGALRQMRCLCLEPVFFQNCNLFHLKEFFILGRSTEEPNGRHAPSSTGCPLTQTVTGHDQLYLL